ncbi:MAG: alkaline phosphatase family protein [Prevotellaceae bacterium]|nr:alkaline phosphatase family protein [Candidatus Minthosoma equi]
MKKIFAALLVSLVCVCTIFAQPELQQRPKLVVGIVVDQMRWDYLTRFNDRYCDGGFRRMMNEGYNCNRLLINYIPTVTAVGHTAVYTGTVPAFNGIIGNSMRFEGKWDTPVRDWDVKGIGTQRSEGQASPHRMLTTTMTDELRLSSNFRSKVISVSLKDRGAILPGGHCANAAYWMDSESMDFVTSTYYMQQFPQWVKDFNKKRLGVKYLDEFGRKKKKDGSWEKDFWKMLYPEDTYIQSTSKDLPYYVQTTGTILKYLPQGNTFTTDMALAALEGEKLGTSPDGITDFLCISYSCTDMIGHKVGPNAPWVEDTYLRLDLEIKRLLDTFDQKIGKGQWVAFLTADHAASHNIEFRHEHGIPAGAWPYHKTMKDLNDSIKAHYGISSDVIESLECQQIYFNESIINSDSRLNKAQITDYVISLLEQKDEVAYAFRPKLIPDYIPEPVRTMAINGYHPKRSGDIQVILEANVTEDYDEGREKDFNGIYKGTNHAVWSPYDAHIPFIIMGKGVRHAWDNSTYHVTDIAPTVCALLNIQQPSGCIGDAIDVSNNK